jgi:hypothetical protein
MIRHWVLVSDAEALSICQTGEALFRFSFEAPQNLTDALLSCVYSAAKEGTALLPGIYLSKVPN